MSTKNPTSTERRAPHREAEDIEAERARAYDSVSQAREEEIGMEVTRL